MTQLVQALPKRGRPGQWDIFLDNQLIGDAYFDPNQNKFVAKVEYRNLKLRIYRNTEHGITRAVSYAIEQAERKEAKV